MRLEVAFTGRMLTEKCQELGKKFDAAYAAEDFINAGVLAYEMAKTLLNMGKVTGDITYFGEVITYCDRALSLKYVDADSPLTDIEINQLKAEAVNAKCSLEQDDALRANQSYSIFSIFNQLAFEHEIVGQCEEAALYWVFALVTLFDRAKQMKSTDMMQQVVSLCEYLADPKFSDVRHLECYSPVAPIREQALNILFVDAACSLFHPMPPVETVGAALTEEEAQSCLHLGQFS